MTFTNPDFTLPSAPRRSQIVLQNRRCVPRAERAAERLARALRIGAEFVIGEPIEAIASRHGIDDPARIHAIARGLNPGFVRIRNRSVQQRTDSDQG